MKSLKKRIMDFKAILTVLVTNLKKLTVALSKPRVVSNKTLLSSVPSISKKRELPFSNVRTILNSKQMR
jgi:hypothetical protein